MSGMEDYRKRFVGLDTLCWVTVYSGRSEVYRREKKCHL